MKNPQNNIIFCQDCAFEPRPGQRCPRLSTAYKPCWVSDDVLAVKDEREIQTPTYRCLKCGRILYLGWGSPPNNLRGLCHDCGDVPREATICPPGAMMVVGEKPS